MTDFQSLGLSPTILKSVKALGFETPTPIQSQAIPIVMEGKDLMGLAQTGTGKTAAFGLPLVHHLLSEKDAPAPKSVRALILAPTRELVNQIADNLRSYVQHTHLKIRLVVGGTSIYNQVKNLSRGTDILVATPGRLLDLMERHAVFLDSAKYLVLDEADQMLDLGFIHPLRKIAKQVAPQRQTMLFSATMPKQIEELARAFLTNPVRVQVSPPGRAVEEVTQSVHHTGQRSKIAMLNELLAQRPGDLSLVFVRTKHGAEKLMKTLVQAGHPAGSIHGNKSQGQRQRAIAAFRSGEIRVLVATDVAARGIDIPGVSHVYNFDLPEVPENYVHRIGRTARAGALGEAVAFCGPGDSRLLRDIERLMGINIAVVSGEPEAPGARSNRGPSRGRGGAPGGRSHAPSKRSYAPKTGGGGKNWSPMEPSSGEQKKRPARYGDPMEARGSQKRDFANTPNDNGSRRRRNGPKKKLIAA